MLACQALEGQPFGALLEALEMTRIAHAVPSESSGDGAWADWRRPTLRGISTPDMACTPCTA
jgi:hypothetical protein